MRLMFLYVNGRLDTDNFFAVMALLREKGHVCEMVDYKHSRENLEKFDAVCVGHDWSKFTRPIIREANRIGRKTFLIQSEGLFVVRNEWYRKQRPLCQYVATWGPIHEEIFRQRGYKGEIEICGPPRYDKYHCFKPSITKAKCFNLIGVPTSNKIVVFMSQFFDQGPVAKLHHAQKKLTAAVARLASLKNITPVIKIHPQERDGQKTGFSRVKVAAQANKKCVVIDPKGHQHTLEVEDLIYYSSAVISYTSSTLFESTLLGVPAASVNFVKNGDAFWPIPLNHEDLGTATLLHYESELREFVTHLEHYKLDINEAEFVKKFLPGKIDGLNTTRCVDFIHERLV